MTQEVEDLGKQLQLHVHTIGTLESEKSALHAALAHMDQEAWLKARETQALASHFQASHQRVRELELIVHEISSEKRRVDRSNSNKELLKQ